MAFPKARGRRGVYTRSSTFLHTYGMKIRWCVLCVNLYRNFIWNQWRKGVCVCLWINGNVATRRVKRSRERIVYLVDARVPKDSHGVSRENAIDAIRHKNLLSAGGPSRISRSREQRKKEEREREKARDGEHIALWARCKNPRWLRTRERTWMPRASYRDYYTRGRELLTVVHPHSARNSPAVCSSPFSETLASMFPFFSSSSHYFSSLFSLFLIGL